MRLCFWRCVLISVFLAGLVSCGGGGSSASHTITESSSSSFFSSSSAPEQVILAQDIQTYTLDEDGVLEGGIVINVPRIFPSGENDGFSYVLHTRNGGVVEFVPDEISTTSISFSYKPAEDFNGKDDCDIYLTQDSADGGNKQKIKIVFHVLPVEDQNFKFEIINNKVFAPGDVVQLNLPYNPDTQELAPDDGNFRITIGDVSVSYSVSPDGLRFVMPPNLLAGTKAVNVQFENQGRPSKFSRTLISKIDYGEVEYWMGDKGRQGVTYVIVAEMGVDRQKYMDWINKELPIFLSESVVTQYNDYWNLVVIKQIAPGSYAYRINKDRSPIIIADLSEAGESFIKGFVPNYDWVILNTILEGRETGGYPMVLNFSQATTILHEFGHVHAKLADEYADSSVNRDSVYIEGSNPNVSNFNDYDSIPWKHWIQDKTSIPGVNAEADPKGVGAFLGAFYTNYKYYRPMFRSIMSANIAPFGPINSEAWVLATYERMGILGSVTASREMSLRTISIAKNWDKNITRIDWFLDDIKQDAWTNQSAIVIDESKIAKNSYSVKVELTDLLGYVRNPHAYPAFKWFNYPDIDLGDVDSIGSLKNAMNENFQKQWIFEKAIMASTTKLQKQASQSDLQTLTYSDEWVRHKILIDVGEHRLVSSARYDLQDTLRAVTAHSELRANILDASGQRLYSVGVDTPYRYYHDATGLVTLKGNGGYVVKHPYVKGNYQLEIIDIRTKERVAIFTITQ